jgi:hypothetical protein
MPHPEVRSSQYKGLRMQVLLLRGASANSGVEVHTMTIERQFKNKVARVVRLAAIRDRMVQEDTMESLVAADLLQQMIEKSGRRISLLATCYPSVG